MSRAATIAPLAEGFDAVRGWLADSPRAESPPRTLADEIAARFGLDAFGRNLLLLCAWCALEPEAAPRLVALGGGADPVYPGVGLALARLPGANWQALTAEAPLRQHGLIALSGAGPVTMQSLHLNEAVLFALMGAPALGAESAGLLRPVTAPAALTPGRALLRDDIAARLSLPNLPVLHLLGPDRDGKLAAFAAAAARIGAPCYALDALALPPAQAEIAALARAVDRDLTLTGARLVLLEDDVDEDAPARRFTQTLRAPLAVISTGGLAVGRRPALRLEMPPISAAEQRPVWEAALGEMRGRLNGTLEQMSSTFRVAPELADTIAAELTASAPDGSDTGEDHRLARAAWAACRRAARPRMDDLARRIDSPADWDDLILPPRQKATLQAIVSQVRNRARVYEDWGFGARLHHKGLGVSALFSGPSGSGKSMAGEVIGNALDLDVYRVDLASMVSKWVGETEKNLRRVFDAAEEGGVILQFDEADALFGRRSEVKDARDRHANLEVSYLLQRLEAYRGLCILTTNLRDNIDTAFLRRIRFVVEFRFPGPAEREAIWRGVFPADAPCEGLDFARLAQLNVAGGTIRNVALGASFLAAEQGGAVTMPRLREAARQEFDKIGRSMTDAEIAGWPQ